MANLEDVNRVIRYATLSPLATNLIRTRYRQENTEKVLGLTASALTAIRDNLSEHAVDEEDAAEIDKLLEVVGAVLMGGQNDLFSRPQNFKVSFLEFVSISPHWTVEFLRQGSAKTFPRLGDHWTHKLRDTWGCAIGERRKKKGKVQDVTVYMEHFYSAFAGIYRDRKFSPHRGRTTDFDVLPSSTGNFPLIADGLQTFDVLPSSTGNFLLLVHGLQTLDVLPSSTGNFPLIVDGLQTFDVLSRRSA
ncbi:hypothetical protein TNCV_3751211 [Trichonephila clavipes]|uniref:Uncharacterized protein n=1 Tax=Trichonephila clavipes TaxID=2585209 RepID=A0A8X6UTA7_TRICX|nr:hypothetical protein TNCV_3751211 [Trichonephila clavipes]